MRLAISIVAAWMAAALPGAAHGAVPARDSLAGHWRDVGGELAAPPSAGPFEPAGIAVDAFGRAFVSDDRQHRVARFDALGHWLGADGTLGSDVGQFRRPGAVVLSGTLQVAVLDRENQRVIRYDAFGHVLGVMVDLTQNATGPPLGHVDPVDLAADRGGSIAIADRDAERLLIFDVAGRYDRQLGGFGERAGLFHGLSGVAFTPRGDLVTTERAHARVQRLNPGGRAEASWPLPAATHGGALPVAVAESGRVAVADETSGELWLFDSSGTLLASSSNLSRPRALAFGAGDTLWVAEGAAGRVRRLVCKIAAGDSARTE
jgi:streptogramin lyase